MIVSDSGYLALSRQNSAAPQAPQAIPNKSRLRHAQNRKAICHQYAINMKHSVNICESYDVLRELDMKLVCQDL